MKKNVFVAAMVLPLILMPVFLPAQAPSLGTASGFALFTGSGAFSNVGGGTNVTGNIGTNLGTVTGFPPGTLVGTAHVANATSAQVANDVLSAYNFLNAVSCGSVMGTSYGSKTLTPNVYCSNANSVLSGTLTLDALGNPNALFIIKINGALTTAISSMVRLVNGASKCNVYWHISDQVSLGINSTFVGNIISNNKITLLQGANLHGRALTLDGPITMRNNVVNLGIIPAASTITASGATTFCEGGSVILSGNSGGVWSNGSTASSIAVSTSGTYYVTNTLGCIKVNSNAISVTVNPSPNIIVNSSEICMGDNTVLTASGALNYVWGPATGLSSTTGSTVNCSPSSNIIYTITGTNAAGCMGSATSTVEVHSVPTPTISNSGPITFCQGGSVILSCSPANSYVWSNSVTSHSINVNTSGTYFVTVTDGNGCSATSTSVNVIVNPLPTASISASGPTTFCDGGSVVLTVSSASSYLWSTAAPTQSILVNNTGNYSVTITDGNGCMNTASASVVVNPNPTVTVNSSTICAGSSATLNAGGAAAYVWQPGSSNGSSMVVSPSSSANYTVIGTSSEGCNGSAIAAVVVNQNPSVNASAGTSAIYLCYGPNCSTLTANVSGGTAPYSYTWSTGSNNSTAVVCPTVSSAYTVTSSDANGCSAMAQVNVGVTDACCENNNNNVKVVICHNGKEICISANAVPAHLAHGDQVGPCSSSRFDNNDNENTIGAIPGIKVYPNPFNSKVNISITSQTGGYAKVIIKDINGKVISTLFNGTITTGETMLNWTPSSDHVSHGIYFCELMGPEFVRQVKLILVE